MFGKCFKPAKSHDNHMIKTMTIILFHMKIFHYHIIRTIIVWSSHNQNHQIIFQSDSNHMTKYDYLVTKTSGSHDNHMIERQVTWLTYLGKVWSFMSPYLYKSLNRERLQSIVDTTIHQFIMKTIYIYI